MHVQREQVLALLVMGRCRRLVGPTMRQQDRVSQRMDTPSAIRKE